MPQIIEHHVMEQNQNSETETHMGNVEIGMKGSFLQELRVGYRFYPNAFPYFYNAVKIQVARFGAFRTSIMCLDLYGLHYYMMVTMHLKSTKKHKEILKMRPTFVLNFYKTLCL